jgi:hypothetical protein
MLRQLSGAALFGNNPLAIEAARLKRPFLLSHFVQTG